MYESKALTFILIFMVTNYVGKQQYSLTDRGWGDRDMKYKAAPRLDPLVLLYEVALVLKIYFAENRLTLFCT